MLPFTLHKNVEVVVVACSVSVGQECDEKISLLFGRKKREIDLWRKMRQLTRLLFWTGVVGVKGVIFGVVCGADVNVIPIHIGEIHCGVVTTWDFSGGFVDDWGRDRRKLSDGRVAFMFFWIVWLWRSGRGIVPVAKEIGESECRR